MGEGGRWEWRGEFALVGGVGKDWLILYQIAYSAN